MTAIPSRALRKRMLELPEAAHPTAERLAKVDDDDVLVIATDAAKGGAVASRAVRVMSNPLDRYYRQQRLDRADPDRNRILYDVGEDYAALAFRAGQTPRPAMVNLHRVDGGDTDPDGLKQALAWDKLHRADQALRRRGCPAHVSVLRAVCCEGISAAEWGKRFDFRERGTGLAYLRTALRLLAEEWGRIRRGA